MQKILAFLAVLWAGPAFADFESGTLTGSFGFYGDRCEDNSKAEGCVMTFQISGEAAKALYDRIKWKPQPDACTEGLVKDSRNGMRCFKVKGEYSCDFGYSFVAHRMTGSDVTC